MGNALSELLGEQAEGLAASVVNRLKTDSADEFEQWHKRDRSGSCWALMGDGIHTQTCTEDSDGQCLLVILGVKSDG